MTPGTLLLLVALSTFQQKTPIMSTKKGLDRIYENMVIQVNKADYIRTFDLDHRDVSAFMVEKMNTLSYRGSGTSSASVMGELIKDNPGKTVEWLLDHYDQFSPVGMSHMAESLCRLENRECFQVLLAFLEDKRAIVDANAAALYGPPYWHERICDRAFAAIAWMVERGKILPREFNGGISPHDPINERDEKIQKFKAWWAPESEVILQKAPALAATRPSLQNKVESVLRKAAVKSDSKNGTRK